MTKKEQLLSMLKKPFGAKRETIMAKLGWQEHSVRGQISLLKKEGYQVVGTKGANGFVYKIVASEIKNNEKTTDKSLEEQGRTTNDNLEEQVQ